MSKASQTDKPLDQVVEAFYKPCTSTGAFSESILKLRKTYKEHKTKPVPPIFKSRLDGVSAAWKVFKRLAQATEYADTFTKDCMVFSYEEKLLESSGQRLFLVTHPKQFWINHEPRPLHERCTYEVIREDAPCKLYFDLEFNKIYNPQSDGIKMTEIFIKCIIASLMEEYNLNLTIENFLWLDSSTAQKYSCHLILQIPHIVFQNNIQAGYFVSLMLTNIRKRIENNAQSNSVWPSSEELQYLFVKNADNRSVSFCDEGVYTRNRNFRLFLSTKFGKSTPLLLSGNNKYVPILKEDEKKDESIFYDSLVTYFRNGKAFKRLLNCDQSKTLNNIPKNNLPPRLKLGFSGVPPYSSPSPYPEVDEFISSIVKDDSSTGFIRKWSYLDNEELIIYDIGNYRYCSRIGRHHRSNNIMIIVDMRRKVYYQKCHDPDCRKQGYKSTAKALPEHITTLYNVPDDFFEADCFSQLQNESAYSSNKALTCSSEKNIIEENQISDGVLEDLLLDPFPFTQLCPVVLENPKTTCDSPVKSATNVYTSDNVEASFVADISFDDLCMEDLESEFATQTTKNGHPNLCHVLSSPDNHVQNFSEETDKRLNSEEMSSEDELMMAEAASVVEVSFNESMFSEETIF